MGSNITSYQNGKFFGRMFKKDLISIIMRFHLHPTFVQGICRPLINKLYVRLIKEPKSDRFQVHVTRSECNNLPIPFEINVHLVVYLCLCCRCSCCCDVCRPNNKAATHRKTGYIAASVAFPRDRIDAMKTCVFAKDSSNVRPIRRHSASSQ